MAPQINMFWLWSRQADFMIIFLVRCGSTQPDVRYELSYYWDAVDEMASFEGNSQQAAELHG